MVHTCVDSTIEELARLENEPLLTYPMKDQIKNLQVELKCLKMFFWCLPMSEEAGKNFHLQSAMSTFISAVEVANKGLYFAGLNAIRKKLGRNWRLLTSNLLEKVEHFKSEIKKHCNFLFHLSLNSTKFSTDDEVLNFMDCMIMNLKDLNDSKDEVFAPLNNQIGSLEEKLSFFRKFVDFTVKRCSEHQKLEDFLAHILAWANKAAPFILVLAQ
ncbi:hypothetical protein ACH5RR_003425 [Cinchona calisaya]|uniref:Late blight resistance protein R1A-like N-terminal domain-containing protein n=1 Tax=Cinchona calisaya TaxID=153742 RepID=A0ABD3AVD9_9GENT